MKSIAILGSVIAAFICGCASTKNISEKLALQTKNMQEVAHADSFFVKISNENEMTFAVSYFAPVGGYKTSYIIAKKKNKWKNFFYDYSIYEQFNPLADTSKYINDEEYDRVASFLLRKEVFINTDDDSIPLCTKRKINDGASCVISFGLPGKIVLRHFNNPDFYNRYCPVKSRKIFMKACKKIENLFREN